MHTSASSPGLPAALRRERRGDGVCISVRWLRSGGAARLAVACGALVVIGYILLTEGQFQGVFEGVLALAGLGLGYFGLAQVANHTMFVVGEGQLVMRHGPLPWRSALRVDRARVRRVSTSGRHHRLELATTSGEEVVLLQELPGEVAGPLVALLAAELGVEGSAGDAP